MLVATSFTVAAAITRGLDPAVLTLVRFVIAAVLFAPFVALKYSLRPPALKNLAGHGMISATIVGFFWCMFEALRSTSALHTSVIFTIVPGISGVYSAVLLGERLGRDRILALFFGMLGALWVIFGGDVNRLLSLEVNSGDLLFLLGCFLMAFYTPLVKLFHRPGEPMAEMTFWVLATGVGWLLPLAGGRLQTVDLADVPSVVWAGILYLAVFTTIVTFFLTQFATLYLGPTRVMAYSYFYPAFVLVIDWALGHGLPPAAIMPGVMVVLLATVVLQSGAAGSGGRKTP
jgi:drug/metabolite transporter (DMT)-like permease